MTPVIIANAGLSFIHDQGNSSGLKIFMAPDQMKVIDKRIWMNQRITCKVFDVFCPTMMIVFKVFMQK
jgi:hypothetical protein